MAADGRLVPILVRMMEARVGSTVVMQLFSTAPEIAMDRQYRYEHSYLTYFVTLMGQITHFRPESGDPTEFTMEEAVYGRDSRIGPLPFEPMVVDGGSLGRAALAGIWQGFSDLTRERSPDVTHYAEKFWGDVWTVIDAGLEPVLIDLVRDPRDVVASNRAFSNRLGGALFGRPHEADEGSYLRHLIAQMRFRLNEMAVPLPVRRVMIQYEDLINSPAETRERLEAITGIRTHPELISELTQDARDHITSPSVAASIGRWRHDLDVADIRQIERRLGPWMIKLGYEISN
jgi:hypothetical protein